MVTRTDRANVLDVPIINVEKDIEYNFDFKESLKNIPFVPVFGRIMVEEMTIGKKGGIYIPSKQETLRRPEGIVVAIGREVEEFAVGDKIAYGQYSGAVMEGHNGHKYRVMNDIDVVGMIEKGKYKIKGDAHAGA